MGFEVNGKMESACKQSQLRIYKDKLDKKNDKKMRYSVRFSRELMRRFYSINTEQFSRTRCKKS